MSMASRRPVCLGPGGIRETFGWYRPHQLMKRCEPERAVVGVRTMIQQVIGELVSRVDHGQHQRARAILKEGPGVRAGLDQHARRVDGACPRRVVEGGEAAFRRGGHVGAPIEQFLNGARSVRGRRPHQCRLLMPRFHGADVRAVCEQYFHRVHAPRASGRQERRFSLPDGLVGSRHRVRVRACLQ